MYRGPYVKCLFIFSGFNENLHFNGFSTNTQTSTFTKTRRGVAKSFRADGRTDRQTDRHDEADCRFSQFCECA